MIIGNDGDTILSHVYEYFVTNKTIRNARNANQMKEGVTALQSLVDEYKLLR